LEVKIRKITVPGQAEQKIRETPSQGKKRPGRLGKK
jgi:hypothetical protein